MVAWIKVRKCMFESGQARIWNWNHVFQQSRTRGHGHLRPGELAGEERRRHALELLEGHVLRLQPHAQEGGLGYLLVCGSMGVVSRLMGGGLYRLQYYGPQSLMRTLLP